MKQLRRIPESDGTRWLLRGRKGAVQFLLWTVPKSALYPDGVMPADLGYHSYTPRHDGQEIDQEGCEYLDGVPCYYDGSTLNAEPVYRIYQAAGDVGVFARLEEYYKCVFGEPADTPLEAPDGP